MQDPMLDEFAGQQNHTTVLLLTSVRVHDLTRDYLGAALLVFCALVRTALIEAFVWSGAALFFGWLRRLSKPSITLRRPRPVPSCATELAPVGAQGPYRSPQFQVAVARSSGVGRRTRRYVLVALVVAWVALGAVDVSFHAVRLLG